MKNYIDKKRSFVCKKSQQFIIEGSPLQGLYFIRKGKVKTVKTVARGKRNMKTLTRE